VPISSSSHAISFPPQNEFSVYIYAE
jgi:hypothetical protein